MAAPLEVRSRPFRAGELDVLRLGRVTFEAALALQERLVERRIAREVCDTLILCEHDPVVSVARGSAAQGCAPGEMPVVEVERTGEATFHVPGQLVACPILELPEGRRDLERYERDLEQVVIRALAEVDLAGERRPGVSGVWIAGRRVCSIGVAERRWVTWHGLALNLHADFAQLERLQPYGIDPARLANVEEFSELPAHTLLFEVLLVKHACEVFGLQLPPVPPPPAPGPLPIYPG